MDRMSAQLSIVFAQGVVAGWRGEPSSKQVVCYLERASVQRNAVNVRSWREKSTQQAQLTSSTADTQGWKRSLR